jgi:NitT/TauT family transport system substrate-binding protein
MQKYTRRNIVQLAVVGVPATIAGLGALGSSALAQNALRPVRLMTSGATLTVADVLLMMIDKLDNKHGIAVEAVPVGGSSNLMVDAVLSGSAQFGNPGTLTALQAIRAGGDLKIVGSVSNNQLSAVVSNGKIAERGVSPTAPIADRMRAFKGLTIGVNPVGSNYYQMARSYLKQYGLDPDKDVRLVPTSDISAQITGIVQGRTDAVIGASGVVEQAIAQGAAKMWFTCASDDIPGSRDLIVSIIVTRSDVIEKHREDVDALLAALQDGLDAIRTNPETASGKLKSAYFDKLDPVVWDLAWKTVHAGYPTNLSFSRKQWEYWIAADPKGAESYKGIEYEKVVCAGAQA